MNRAMEKLINEELTRLRKVNGELVRALEQVSHAIDEASYEGACPITWGSDIWDVVLTALKNSKEAI